MIPRAHSPVNTTIHESGHVIMAFHHLDDFFIKKIEINNKKLGALEINPMPESKYEVYIQFFLGGIETEKMFYWQPYYHDNPITLMKESSKDDRDKIDKILQNHEHSNKILQKEMEATRSILIEKKEMVLSLAAYALEKGEIDAEDIYAYLKIENHSEKAQNIHAYHYKEERKRLKAFFYPGIYAKISILPIVVVYLFLEKKDGSLSPPIF